MPDRSPRAARPARPFTPRQALENARFLEALRRTGNARLAARQLGVHRSTYLKRRARDAAFAAGWEMALAAAHAAFHLSGGARPPEPDPPRHGEGVAALGCTQQSKIVSGGDDLAATHAKHGGGGPPGRDCQSRTQGGEPTIVRRSNGRLQLRLAPAGRMTAAAEQAFLRALSASANVRLSAAAAGFAHSSFYARARARPEFAEAMRDSLGVGWQRLMEAVHQSFACLAGPMHGETEAEWAERVGDCPLPPMTVDDALQLLRFHHAAAHGDLRPPGRRRRG